MGIAENLDLVRRRIQSACERAGREVSDIQLMAVSKKVTADRIAEAAEAGLRLFGESRVQEAKTKLSQCPSHLTWHMIGHLQSNKARDAVRLFSMIQGVDSLSLAEEINKHADNQAKSMPVLLEVNIGGEAAKHGFKPDETPEQLLRLNELPRLEIHGLMAIAPWKPDPEQARPYFRRMAEVRDRCEQALQAPLPVLSMGMSGDFETAIEEGATLIRVGTSIFGERK